MKPTLQAILAKNQGNRNEAIRYCEDIAHQYPHLRTEYRQYRDALISREEAS